MKGMTGDLYRYCLYEIVMNSEIGPVDDWTTAAFF